MPLDLTDVTIAANVTEQELALHMDGAKVILDVLPTTTTAVSTKLTMSLALTDVTLAHNVMEQEPALHMDGAKVNLDVTQKLLQE